MKSVITHIKGEKPSNVEHLAHIYGTRDIPKPDYFRHIKTGQELSYIAGSLAWPGSHHAAGVGLIVGVIRTDKPDPPFLVLDEVYDPDPHGLLLQCLELRKKWGWRKDLDILKRWTGNAMKYFPFWTGLNVDLLKKEERRGGVYVCDPVDFDKKNHFQLYIHRIGSLRRQKRLSLGSCKALKGYLAALPPDASERKGEDFPAVFALGSLLHTLIATRPWQAHVGVREEFPTMPAERDYQGYTHYEAELAMRDLLGEMEEAGGQEYGEVTAPTIRD